MGLKIGSQPVSDEWPRSFSDILLNTELMSSTSQMFDANRFVQLSSSHSSNLYVFQGEMAVVSPQDANVRVLFTDDTTTCFTVIFRHLRTGITGLMHCDDAYTPDIFFDHMNPILERISRQSNLTDDSPNSEEFDLYMIGGFLDNEHISESLCIQLLTNFNALTQFDFRLKCAFIGAANTVHKQRHGPHTRSSRTVPTPIVYGAAIDVTNGVLFNATLDREEENFRSNIVLEALRHTSVIAAVRRFYFNVYDWQRQQLILEPRRFKNFDVRGILECDDETILRYCSTSPDVEPSHFVDDTRATFRFLLDHSSLDICQQYWPRGVPRVFQVINERWTETTL